MARKPQRKVEAAIVERIGTVTSQQLLAMADDSWGMIRDRITDQRNGKDGLTARCFACDSPVYIRSAQFKGIKRPLFQHYAGSDPTCPWYQGQNMKPDDVRAAQYQGQQESNFHRNMCNLIAELVMLDSRYVRHTVAEYLPPQENEHGRFPDIYVEWESFGPFAIEFQMSGTFQTEISARCKHDERESIPLLWVLFGLETATELKQSVIDVIRRHRGNAFVLDPAAVASSREQKTLVLSCYLRNANGVLGLPKLVRFDELNIPRSKLPYHQDMIVGPRLAAIEELRRPWFDALGEWQADRFKPLRGIERPQSVLIAAAFSIVAAANGKQRNFASDHKNVSGMLNGYLNTGVISRYSDLLTRLIKNTALSASLKKTVWEHLHRYRDHDQADENSSEWQLLRELLPEALDQVLREEWTYLDSLPNWAKSQ